MSRRFPVVGDAYVDMRAVISRLKDLESDEQLAVLQGGELDELDTDEITSLRDLMNGLVGNGVKPEQYEDMQLVGDWEFENHIRELALEENPNGWLRYVDWERAAQDVKREYGYRDVEWNEHTYWYRG